jgi:hypothetical protein
MQQVHLILLWHWKSVVGMNDGTLNINEAKSDKDFEKLIGGKVDITNTAMGKETEQYEITEIRWLNSKYGYGITFTHLNHTKSSGQSGWGETYFYHITDKELKNIKAGKKHELTRSLYIEPK